MTQEEKDALVEKMAKVLRKEVSAFLPMVGSWDDLGDIVKDRWKSRAEPLLDAALAIAEPVIREKAMKEAANSLNDMKRPACSGAFDVHSARAWNGVLDYAQDHIRKLSEAEYMDDPKSLVEATARGKELARRVLGHRDEMTVVEARKAALQQAVNIALRNGHLTTAHDIAKLKDAE